MRAVGHCSNETRALVRPLGHPSYDCTLEMTFSQRVFDGLALVALLLLVTANVWGDEGIRPSPALPDTTPWDLPALSRPPSFRWIDSQAPVRSLIYAGPAYGGKPTQVFAYYASPRTLADDAAADENLPAIVLVHGGGGTAFSEWAELWARRGYAAIAMDLAGHRPLAGQNPHHVGNRIRLEQGGPNQGDQEKFGSIDKPPRDQWPYHAVANTMLAHSLIRSFEGVDGTRTAVTGISWGGYLTCIVAAIDNRFRAAVPVYGCGFLHENSVWLDRFADMHPDQRDRWVRLWEPSRYLPAVSMPILLVNGTNDFAYPLDSYMKSFDAIPGRKQLSITVNMPHGHQAGWTPQVIERFIDYHLGGTEPLPEVGEVKIMEGRASWEWQGTAQVAQTELHYTTDSAAINRRQWKSNGAAISGQRATAMAPPHNATAWFVTVQDKWGAVISSRVATGR